MKKESHEEIHSPRSLRKGISKKLSEYVPFRKKKLNEALSTIPSEQKVGHHSSLWHDKEVTIVSDAENLDEKELDTLILNKLHHKAGTPVKKDTDLLLKSYSREQKVNSNTFIE